jgi:4-diphosphocytidyl-2-C-methyl-D-erythritol kinase
VLRQGRAPAKLNLALELTGHRPDGYHLLAAVSQTIDWSDVVALESVEAGADFPAIPRLKVWGPEAHRVPAGADNLAVRAALLLRERHLGAPVARLALDKRIPTQSGLGGGSADAAAVLRMAGQGGAAGELEEVALSCGADVPFSLRGGAALLSGIGEQVSPLPTLTSGAFLIVVLGAVATADAYRATRPEDFSGGERVARLAKAMRQGQPLDPSLFGSGLQPAALRALPELERRLRTLSQASPSTRWAMTGSGGAFFTYLPDGRSAAELARVVARCHPRAGIRVALPSPPESPGQV